MPDTGNKRDIQTLLALGRESIKEGALPGALVASPELHAIETERVFGRCWQFLAHESEVPRAGDYVVRYLAGSSVIVVRGEDDIVRAMANSCRHRGTLLCRTEMGNTSHFRCPYHGWTYKNSGSLAGVPAERDVYGKVDKEKWSLTPVPRVENYAGLIFGCLDENASSLADYLSDMTWYLDLIAKRSKSGLEVRGEPQRWVVDSNWKLGSDNFVGDGYHTFMAHRFAVDLQMVPPDVRFGAGPSSISLPNGHGLGVVSALPVGALPPYMGYPQEIVDGLPESYGDQEHVDVLKRSSFIHGTVFPNLSFLNVNIGKDHKSPPVPMLTFRLWRPLSYDSMEIWTWFLIERDAPEEFKQESYEAYVRTFGISGVFEQDDTEVWRAITKGTQGLLNGSQMLSFEMGLGVIDRLEDWEGPGCALTTDYAEQNQREFWGRWLELVSDSERDDTGSRPQRPPQAPYAVSDEEAAS